MNRLVPDYFTAMQQLDMNPVLEFLLFAVQFYGAMLIFIVLNFAMVAIVLWSLLILFRLLGIPWVDGTTQGLIDRR